MIKNYFSQRLFTPGPTPIPPQVAHAIAQPQPHHKSAEFREMMQRIIVGLQNIFQTAQLVLPLTCSGTGGVEAAMLAVHRKGDEVIVINNGRFAARWKEMLETHGITVREIAREWGEIVSANELSVELTKRDADAVWIVHSETSTGALSDLSDLCRAVQQLGSRALVCADCITSIGVHNVPMDAMGLDIAVASSQKAFMSPPGLAFVSLSKKAWQVALRPDKFPTIYFDLFAARKNLAEGLAVFTPAVNSLSGLDAALSLMRSETLPAIILRHEELSDIVRACIRNIGLHLLSEYPSNAVTVLRTPGFGVELVRTLRENYDIIIENGQDHLRNEIVRIGHLGWYSRDDVTNFCDDFARAVEIVRPRSLQMLVERSIATKHREIILATNNKHKVKEISDVLSEMPSNVMIKLMTLDEVGLSGIHLEETGTTLEENAFIKASAIFRLTGKPALADDTGLEVAELNNAPGVYSARFAGENASDADNRNKLSELLKNSADRSARFRTVLCMTDEIRTIFAEGMCIGSIAAQATGTGGFGYDSLFVPENKNITFAEMSAEEKNAISHRSRAAKNLLAELAKYE